MWPVPSMVSGRAQWNPSSMHSRRLGKRGGSRTVGPRRDRRMSRCMHGCLARFSLGSNPLGLLASAAFAVLTATNPAVGADMSSRPLPTFVPPPLSWTGFYIGANLGGGWAHSTLNDSFTGISLGNSSSGVVDGGQLGYNYQFGGLVLGAEWTFDGTSLNAPRTVGALQGTGNTKSRLEAAGPT